MQSPLVTTRWLDANLNLENLVLVDVSMSKVVGKTPIEYDAPVYLPNSKRLDLEGTLCNLASPQVHAFPTESQFTRAARAIGINRDSMVVLYDNQGIYAAPRAWWIFQAMGFGNAFVLDGGLPKWLSEGRRVAPTLSGADAAPGNVHGQFQPQLVCDASYLSDHLHGGSITVLDARSRERFLGLAPEPRAGVRSGHIPGSLNLPFTEVLDGHCYKSPEQLAAVFAGILDDRNTRLVFSCGSGITACITLLAAIIAGYNDTVLYDGSWSDWGSDMALPVEP